MIRQLLRFTCAALIPVFLFVCDVDAQARRNDPRINADTALFQGDTVLLHSVPAKSILADQYAGYITRMRRLPGLPRATTPVRIDIFLAEDERAFTELTGGAAPHWGAGVADPDKRVIVLPAYSSKRGGIPDIGPVIRHEIAHVELQRTLDSLRIPRWFTEGYAVWSAGQLDPDADWYLRLAFLTQRAPSLDSLELGWPQHEMDARVAYLLSASAVAYLHSLGGDAAFDAFILAWKRSGSLEESMRATYLISTNQFETLWSKHIRKRYGWLLFAVQGTVAWAFLTAVVVLMIFYRRRRDRRRMEELRRNEPPDAPAYWVEGYVEPAMDEDAEPESGQEADSRPGRVDDGPPV